MTISDCIETMNALREFCSTNKIHFSVSEDILSIVYQRNAINLSIKRIESIEIKHHGLVITMPNYTYLNILGESKTIIINVFG